MPYLIDTDVLLETRRRERDSNVVAWLESTPDEVLRVSVIAFGEVWRDVQLLRHQHHEEAEHLEAWANALGQCYADRIVPVTTEIADEWGRLNCPDPLPLAVGLIAATAKVHGWMLVTRNVADYERTGVAILNPFEPPAAN